MQTDRKIINRFQTWSVEQWNNRFEKWLSRSKSNLNYRNLVVEPIIINLIMSFGMKDNISVADLGCGDGEDSLFWMNMFSDLGITLREITLYDSISLFLDNAKNVLIKSGINPLRINTIEADVTRFDIFSKHHCKFPAYDFMIASYLFHNVADLPGLLKFARTIASKYSYLFALAVHPDFTSWLINSSHSVGVFKPPYNNLDQKSCDWPSRKFKLPIDNERLPWQFAGLYPIIGNHDSKQFFVPYFHRTLNDYARSFTEAGFQIVKTIPLKPNKLSLQVAIAQNILPFVKFDGNIYYPRICTHPSSVLWVLTPDSK